MAYILKSRRVRRGMPLGDDSGGGFFDSVSSAISSAGDALSTGLTNISNTPLTNGAGTVGGAFNYAANSSAPPAPSSGSGVADAIGAFFNVFGKSALPVAPTVIMPQNQGMSPTTMIALAIGGVALVALLARRSS